MQDHSFQDSSQLKNKKKNGRTGRGPMGGGGGGGGGVMDNARFNYL